MDRRWATQVRSYVVGSDSMVKDLRTGVETHDLPGVLDGDLDAFLTAAAESPQAVQQHPSRLMPETQKNARSG